MKISKKLMLLTANILTLTSLHAYTGQAYDCRAPFFGDPCVIDKEYSSLSVTSAVVAADGSSEANITLHLKNRLEDPITDVTQIALRTTNTLSQDVIISEVDVSRKNQGRYSFKVKSSVVQEDVSFYIRVSEKHSRGLTQSTEDIRDINVSFISNTRFETKHPYVNNTAFTRTLSIPKASSLKVHISGSVEEDYDHLSIREANGNKQSFSGILAEDFEVEGSSIDVSFMSDGAIAKQGATVTIEDANKAEASDTFETPHPYANKQNITKVISTNSDTKQSIVTISGELEKRYDFIYIIDAQGISKRYTGILNQSLTVNGNQVTVRFTSDNSVVKNGVTVIIAPK